MNQEIMKVTTAYILMLVRRKKSKGDQRRKGGSVITNFSAKVLLKIES